MVEGRREYVELHVTPNKKRLHVRLSGVGGRARPVDEPLSFEEMLVAPVGFESSVTHEEKGWSVSAKIPAAVLCTTANHPILLCPEANIAHRLGVQFSTSAEAPQPMLFATQGTGTLHAPVSRLRFDFRPIGRFAASFLLHGTPYRPLSPLLLKPT